MNTKLSYHWAITTFLTAFTSCSSGDITTGTVAKPNAGKTETDQVSFATGNQGTRTSLDRDDSNFYWEAGDKIFVKDDENKFYGSSNAVTGTNAPGFRFMIPGKYSKNKYMVYYPGKDKTNDNVTTAATQTQNGANNAMRSGTSGDYGVGEATLGGEQYKFRLTHSAAYLCFKPSYDHLLEISYVTRVEVITGQNITGNYTLGSDGKLACEDGGSKIITLTPKGTSNAEGFKLKNNLVKTSCETGRMFMVIASRTHTLTMKCYITDTQAGTTGTIIKTFGSAAYAADKYYDISAKLTMRALNTRYYTWDVQKDYWFGRENDQPRANGSNNITTFPASSGAQRWYNSLKYQVGVNSAASNSAKNYPNINELRWCCLKDGPRWDTMTVWTVQGHIYTNSMWFKKAEVVAKENNKGSVAALKTVSPGGRDRMINGTFETPRNNNNVVTGAPTSRKDYFFVPATRYYEDSELKDFRTAGLFQVSTPGAYISQGVYNLYFASNSVVISNLRARNSDLKLWTSK